MRLENKIAVITASTRGIGLACVRAFAAEGATVYMAARNEVSAEAEAVRLVAHGYKVRWVYNDAAVPESFETMIEKVIENEGRIDILVNNFGTSDPKKDLDLANTDPQYYLETVSLNLRSVFAASRAAAKHMRRQGSGSIINISSIGGTVPDISQISYGTAKSAINYLTKLIALQEGRYGIRCNAVLPGMTATEAVENKLSDEFRKLFLKHIPLGRMATPVEIAEAVLYFASDASAYTTGQILEVAGGFGLGTPIYGDIAQHPIR